MAQLVGEGAQVLVCGGREMAAAVAEAMADSDLPARFRAMGAEPAASGRAALAARIVAEDARWGALVRDVGITLE